MILALPIMAFALQSCDDDNDFPPVDITVNIEGATQVDNTLYVVQGEPFNISSITLTDNTTKGAVIGSATYFWDYANIGGTIVKPYGISFDTSVMPLGEHLLQINISVYAVDYSPCMGLISNKVVVVASTDDIPSSGNSVANPSIGARLADYADPTSVSTTDS